MLTKRDLGWNYGTFFLVSRLNLIPMIFERNATRTGLENEMRGQKSTWRKLMFHAWQTLFLSHCLYVDFRAAQFAAKSFSGDSGDLQKDLDLVPLTMIMAVGFIALFLISFFVLGRGRDLSVKLYNEVLKIRGKFIKI